MSQDMMNMLISVLPILVLVGAWYFFMRQMRGPNGLQSQSLELMRRQTEAYERIAAALEKRGAP